MPQAENEFYRGLLVYPSAARVPEKIRLFEKALTSSNIYIRQAAAEELAILVTEGRELSTRTARRVRQEISGPWAAAFDAVGFPMPAKSDAPDKEKVLMFLLGFDGTAGFNEARVYVMRECEKQEEFFTGNELAVIEGHYAVSRARYNEARDFFRAFQEDGSWPARMPQIFHEYPVLVNDLGRALQYTDTGREARDLFLQWESDLTAQKESAPELAGKFDDLRYRLLFYAARIARRMSQNTQAIALFERSLAIAPDFEQSDACIWYILDTSLPETTAVFLRRLEQYVSGWHDGSSYNDILERYLQKLVTGKEWERIIRTFALINNTGAFVSRSGYAWVIARAIEEGYLNNAQMRLASQAVNVETADASTYMRIVYNTGIYYVTQTLYYRWLSANALEMPFLDFSEEPAAPPPASKTKKNEVSPVLDFLLGFFRNGATEFAMRYIRPLERGLAPEELRALSQALSEAGIYNQSIRLVLVYINREGYKIERRDLELLFPRYFTDLIERYANEYSITPSLFFGLVRQESAFQSAVVSRAGAVGLSQLMPATARDTAARMRRSGIADYTENLEVTNPSINVHIGTFYLNSLVESFDGDMMLALLAYNGGPNRVRRWRAATNLPADLFMETVSILETRDYGRKVLSSAKVYEELYYK
jgi:soluble lytic murein transglycosylase